MAQTPVPVTKAEQNMDKRYATWTRQKRMNEAAKRVLYDGWSQVRASETFGVSRPRLNQRVKKLRDEAAAKEAALQARKDQAGSTVVQLERELPADVEDTTEDPDGSLAPAIGINERRRVPGFEEFDRLYFGHWVCPDCDKHHEMPGFHHEIWTAARDPETRRMVVNVPPYHAKSTLLTVKDTVLDIVTDPNLRTLIVSKSLPFAQLFLGQIKELLTNPDLYAGAPRSLIEDWGPFDDGASQWNQNQIFVAGRVSAEKDPTVLVCGVGGQIYGRRADKIKFDDIADTENQKNPDRVLSMLEWIDKMALSRIGKKGKAFWAGTRVAHGDVYSTLRQRPGYKVIAYPAIIDDVEQVVLWPDHFPYWQVELHRNDMKPADFQLIYQNVDLPGLSASFPPEIVDDCKDTERVNGQWDQGWRFIAGLDPAGANKKSGYTAIVVLAVDTRTGKRFLVDNVNVKAMKAPQLRDTIFELTAKYPIFEWRVESNGLQAQLVQYNEEIIRHLSQRGVKVTPHFTHGNKWDPQFGVESMAPLFHTQMISIPWAGVDASRTWQPFIEQLIAFPMAAVSDLVMAFWFAELGCRDVLRRQHMPMFNERMRVPERVRRRRHVVDFHNREARHVPLHEQRPGHMLELGQANFRRLAVGRPTPHADVREVAPPDPVRFVNIGPGEGP